VGDPTVLRLDVARHADFYRVHSEANGCGWCRCVAWWVPTWDGWGERSNEANEALRRSLFERGEDDGYLIYAEGAPVGWAQVGRRDRLAKLVVEYRLAPEPDVWAVTCLLLAPHVRRRGLARFLMQEILHDLPGRGAVALEAFPRRGDDLEAGAVWTGPERLFVGLGFQQVQDHPRRPRFRRDLRPGQDARV
jgi:GNAT superfamily N-acetyltransferase